MKRIIVSCTLLLLFSNALAQVKSDATNLPSDDMATLSSTAKSFFETWIVERKTKSALRYLSARPVLGSCMIPKALDKKRPLTRSQIQSIFNTAMEVTLKKLRRGSALENFITGQDTNIVSEADGNKIDHTSQKYFSIYALKPLDNPKDNGYVCKSDEQMTFLDAISSPDARYIFTRVYVLPKYKPFILTTVWKNESGKWRILTFSATTDDN